jgi:hypothetical protein
MRTSCDTRVRADDLAHLSAPSAANAGQRSRRGEEMSSRRAPLRQISHEQLRQVTGGDGTPLPAAQLTPAMSQEVLTPRDPASGLPTGKRM